MKELGIYIHIPFCKSKCRYCDFNSYAGCEGLIPKYTEALTREIQVSPYGSLGKNNMDKSQEVTSIYIGGGTPTYIDEKYIVRIMNAVRESFRVSENAEITIECNPGTADADKLAALRECGINRISIGMQSSSDDMLKKLGRIHSFAELEACIGAARTAGFENLSLDLMFGLPEQTREEWLKTLGVAVGFNPEHISAYSLKIEENTPFYEMHRRGCLSVPDDDENRAMYDDAVEFLASRGYNRYEISNFARNGYESRHNLLYWRLCDYIGFGAGAYSCINYRRFNNEPSPSEYIKHVKTSGSAVQYTEEFDIRESMSEFVFLGLRLSRGISKSEFKERFGMEIFDVFKAPLEKHIALKTIENSGDRIRINDEFIYVSNSIMSDFVDL